MKKKQQDFWGEGEGRKIIALQALINKRFAWELNRQLYGDKPRKLTKWQKFVLEVRYKISAFRIKLGEFIAGESFDY